MGGKRIAGNNLDIETTTSIKGILVLFVFCSHILGPYNTDLSIADKAYKILNTLMGQMIVVPFFFYSGYGIYEQYKNRGRSYIDSFFRTRILKVLLHFDLALLPFAIMNFFTKAHPVSFSSCILTLLGWLDFGNSSWFIFSTISCYVAFFLSVKIANGKKNWVIIGTLSCLIIYIFLSLNCKEHSWYNTILLFSVGMIYSMYKEKINSAFTKRCKLAMVLIVCTFIASYAAAYIFSNIEFLKAPYVLAYTLASTCIMGVILVVSQLFNLQPKIRIIGTK